MKVELGGVARRGHLVRVRRDGVAFDAVWDGEDIDAAGGQVDVELDIPEVVTGHRVADSNLPTGVAVRGGKLVVTGVVLAEPDMGVVVLDLRPGVVLVEWDSGPVDYGSRVQISVAALHLYPTGV
ncbi:hypothetical protein SAMN05444695_1265 [Rhodococcus triatomae]|uniref:TOBE domain-containing protein n=1 Tax=Rhodococcus triatomae TaxID=300028 RepID=A0A1G8SYU5_9NOCA|nr:hypothetical protein [Rhodococcus triatomae]SDJ33945.1 hypothetical protein SAMN05444695_1265 [Rhodococcus triatomae]